jgi:hypothetical protein
MARNESLDDLVSRRNKRLLSFFTLNGFDVRLIGDEQKPAVIMEESVVLSCYVKNFDLYFTKEPFSDEIVKQFKLKHEPEATSQEIQEAITLCQHRPVYKIKISGSDLYLVGYNYLNSEDGIGRYPVFARHHPKVYFDLEYAEKLTTNLCEEGYSLEII